MEIPYTVRPRPDTGLANPKLGIWLFLASEVMLFGGLFAGYIFMRLGAEPWMWPHGWLNVPVGTFNTFVLIASSVTVILSWESLKMRKYKAYRAWLAATWLCGLAFLTIKLSYEWPAKFHHFGAYIQQDSLHKYEAYLGNEDVLDEHGKVVKQGRRSRGQSERRFISGHITHQHENESAADYKTREHKAWADVKDRSVMSIEIEALDVENATEPTSAEHDKAHFIPRDAVHMHHPVQIDKADLIAGFGPFYPRLNTYLACYFMITGLHGLHVLGGCIVFIYFWLPIKGGSKLFYTNPQQLCNRIEVSGLFWHLVDLIWIFVFPLFYLL